MLLAAYRADGFELSFAELTETAGALGWQAARRHAYPDVASLVADAKGLPVTAEGFVLRFSNGLRLKVKGAEYRRIHALISNCTPLAIWEAMLAGDDMAAIRRDLPEEFWQDFDAIIAGLTAELDALVARIAAAAQLVAGLSDKELGLSLASQPADVRPHLFSFRKSGGRIAGRLREALMRVIRPNGNVLKGYVPSYAMDRVSEEAT